MFRFFILLDRSLQFILNGAESPHVPTLESSIPTGDNTYLHLCHTIDRFGFCLFEFAQLHLCLGQLCLRLFAALLHFLFSSLGRLQFDGQLVLLRLQRRFSFLQLLLHLFRTF